MRRSRCHRLLLAAVVVLLEIGVSYGRYSAAAEILPARIDDDAFWRLVTDFSEGDRPFLSENFVSNEPNFQQILARLKENAKPGGAYLGVGPEQNFTYIAAVQPGIAFIVDIRRQNLIQHLMYKAIFELAQDRADFLSMLFSRKRPEGLTVTSTPEDLFKAYKSVSSDADLAAANLRAIQDLLLKHNFSLSTADLQALRHVHRVFELYGPLTSYSSNLNTPDFTNGKGDNGNFSTILTAMDDRGVNQNFLATEEQFRFIKDMEAKNLVVPIVGDFAGNKALNAIARYLKDHEASVSVFYVSNVEQYLFQKNAIAVNGGAEKFYENVAGLPMDAASTFVRSYSSREVKQLYPGFVSQLGSMLRTVQVFREKGFRSAREAIELSP